MSTGSTVRALIRDVARIDRPTVPIGTASRNAIGVVLPLALGLAIGQGLTGLNVAVGALIVALLDEPGSYAARARKMLLASLAGGMSAAVGSATGSFNGIAVVQALLWGFGAGMLVALGNGPAQVGLGSIMLLVIYGAFPLAPDQAAIAGALVLAGGAFQTLLSISNWPFRPLGPERHALAVVLRELADLATRPTRPPATFLPAGVGTAREVMSGIGRSHTRIGEDFRVLLEDVARIHLELLALDDARQHLAPGPADDVVARLAAAVQATIGDVCLGLSRALDGQRVSVELPDSLRQLARAIRAVEPVGASLTAEGERWRDELGIMAESLVELLQATAETVRAILTEVGQPGSVGLVALSRATDPSDAWATIRANLTPRSATFRHALRLAVGLAVGTALARALDLPRGAWVPLIFAVVLRPDFIGTFARGVECLAGTLLGLLVAAALAHLAFGNVPALVVMVGFLAFAIRRLASENFGLAVVAITALVVILLHFLGASAESTIVPRGIDTLIGGTLAFVGYALWPTWERARAPAILADLLDADRRYFDAVVAGYLDRGRIDPGSLDSIRLAARLARSNARTSIDRLRAEPVRSEPELDRAGAVLVRSNQVLHATLALEAVLYGPAFPSPTGLASLAADVDRALQALARQVRAPEPALEDLPNLRADQRVLARAADGGSPELLALATETARVVRGLDALAQILRPDDSRPASGRASVPRGHAA